MREEEGRGGKGRGGDERRGEERRGEEGTGKRERERERLGLRGTCTVPLGAKHRLEGPGCNRALLAGRPPFRDRVRERRPGTGTLR